MRIQVVRRDRARFVVVPRCKHTTFTNAGGSHNNNSVPDESFDLLGQDTQCAGTDARDNQTCRPQIDGSAGQPGVHSGMGIEDLDLRQPVDGLDIEFRVDRVAAADGGMLACVCNIDSCPVLPSVAAFAMKDIANVD